MKTPLIVGVSSCLMCISSMACAQQSAISTWESLTGWELTPRSCIALEDGLAVLTSDDGKQLDTLPWMESARWPAKEMEENGYHVEVEVADGWLCHGGGRTRFVAVVIEYGAGDQEFTTMIPLASGEGADGMVEAIPDSDEVSIECFNPTWVGNAGQQCCGYVLSLEAGIEACASRFWLHVFACIPASVTLGAGSFAWCSQYCVLPPLFIPACLKSCLVLGGVTTAGALVACLAGAEFAYNECVSEQWSLYWQNLTNAGCELRRPRI
jgi:hypothetical protein